MKKSFVFSVLFLTAFLYAQKPKDVLKLINNACALNKNFYYEIPFVYKNEEIVIQVKIGGRVYDYIFDTGGYNNITDAIQQDNNFPVLSTQTVGSSNQIKTKINIVKADTLKIGQLIFTDLAVLQMNYDNSPTIKCTINGGLIGASIIKNYIWQIDYPNRKIIVTDNLSKVGGLENSIKVPVTFNNRLMPYIKVSVDGRTEKMMFDTGSSALFSMTDETASRYIREREIITIDGGGTEGANGIVKEDIGIFKAASIVIGNKINFFNKPVIFAKSSNENLIGNAIIKKYSITLNFKDGEMYFSPLINHNQRDGWESFGLTMNYNDDKIKIESIYKGLSAHNHGLKVGDEVIKIDNKSADCNTYCDCKIWLSNYIQEAQTILITVLTEGKEKEIVLTKEKVF